MLAAADRSAILEEAPHSAPAAMMKKWKQMLGKQATYEQLRQVLEECGRIDLVEKIKQLVVDSHSKSEQTKIMAVYTVNATAYNLMDFA